MTAKTKTPPSFAQTHTMTSGNAETVNVDFSAINWRYMQEPFIAVYTHYSRGTTNKHREVWLEDDSTSYTHRDMFGLTQEMFNKTQADSGAYDVVLKLRANDYSSAMKIVIQTKDIDNADYKVQVANVLLQYKQAHAAWSERNVAPMTSLHSKPV